jgi:serine/threonine protein kinase
LWRRRLGQVYKGKHQDTDEPVAIKEVSLSKVRRRSPEFAARHQQNLRNETECLRSLNHPNIVRLLGAPPPPPPPPLLLPPPPPARARGWVSSRVLRGWALGR